MIDVLWNMISCIGLVAIAFVLIGTCIISVYCIINIIKEMRK